MEKSEFCVLIKHCFLMGKNTVQAKQWLDKCYSDSAPSETMVKRWHADFNQKKATNEEEKSALSPRPWQNCIKLLLQIASTATLFSRSGSQQQLAVCRPQKNAPGKEIWLQWRSEIGSWGIFWGQRQIVLQKRYRIVKEVLESVYHPRRRLCG